MTSRLTFCGGVGEVTGANFHLESESVRIVVDCGMHQGRNECGPENYDPFAYDVSKVDALFVTHAHADHIGRVPRLVQAGFSGVIYSTPATRDLAALMFEDALSLMSRPDAKCEPLYTRADVEKTLELWRGVEYRAPFSIADVTAELFDAGHILGSALVRLMRNGKHILFTGDLGNTPEPLLRDTETPEGAHYIVMESVYGDRVHEHREGRREQLKDAVELIRARHGVLLIPSFSIERTQVILSEMNTMIEAGEMQSIPTYLDAPLSIKATGVYRQYRELLNTETQTKWDNGDDPFAFQGLKITARSSESEAIHDTPNPKVIIAGAGMSHGGRIREHERHYLGDKNTAVLFVGYQSAGSLGRRLQEGAKKVDIDGVSFPVRATMLQLSGYSGHADRDQLLAFLEKTAEHTQQVFVAMGEPSASLFFAQRARDFLGVNATVPTRGETAVIEW